MNGRIQPGAVLDRIVGLYRREVWLLLPAAALLAALDVVISRVVPTGGRFLVAVLFWVLNVIYQGYVVEVVAADEAGRRVTSQMELVRAVTPVLGPLLFISLLYAIGVGIGFVLIIIPGLLLLTIWSVVVPAQVIERRGVFGSFSRSVELVRGNGWSVFTVIVLVFITLVVVLFAALLLSSALGSVVAAIVSWLVDVAAAPVVALSASVLYFSLLKARGERSPAAPGGDSAY